MALDAGPPVSNLDGTDTSKMDATDRKLHALELAKQCGALSEKQYERAKRRVMRKTEATAPVQFHLSSSLQQRPVQSNASSAT